MGDSGRPKFRTCIRCSVLSARCQLCSLDVLHVRVGSSVINQISRRLLTEDDQGNQQHSQCRICVEKLGTGMGFSSSTLVFPCQLYFSLVQLEGMVLQSHTQLWKKKQKSKPAPSCFCFRGQRCCNLSLANNLKTAINLENNKLQ